MKTLKKILSGLFVAGALIGANAAWATGWDHGGHGHHRGWGHDHHHHHHGWRDGRHYERHVIHERRYIYDAPRVYYPAPPVVYEPVRVYPRRPAVVIGVDVPPIVIPF